ncbi:hypothetical protein CAOG_04218 [Capsaspora owczarzaki ATCC 30864]|uniref:Up-regulated during skeletal muscle growth protein 5 n=1 Tax=Capsaspora owczarzaki (strain ATCC 30864) TaxID=595528 RepID=A0A0D2WPN6_CAPO3|nr:hypothetical protein CAOG_04218 [Capsaspora owczarzaki ATCC 30864]KJE93425.1 hypothetical protein CAOG_004218 [Capsaspora owczarzaki ATCC 30864]|eukprot:XP_004348043.1 hypothetical protein CAOG_04218 [Capsaspora owczarzaki ATCC 30864]
MAGGHGHGVEPQFQGIAKIFNSVTTAGRRNLVLATLSGVTLAILIGKSGGSKPVPADAKKH